MHCTSTAPSLRPARNALLPLALACAALSASAQLPPGDGPVTVTGTVLEPSAVRFDESLLPRLKAPAGFTVSVFAKDLGNARWMQVAPNGDVYLSRRDQGDVMLLRDTNRDGTADERRIVAQNIESVHGLALRDNRLYMASNKKVLVADVQRDGTLGTPKVIVDDLPDAGQHPNRTLAFGPDGWLYLSIGSDCNNCKPSNPETATMLRLRLDGSGREVVARGLRNTIGFGWHPTTGVLYGFDHGSDFRGDDIPPEEINAILPNKHYGWPWCYADRQVDRFQWQDPQNSTKADFCPTTEAPQLTYTAHAAPLGWAFYTAQQFPAEYRNSAFVAMRGSWNRGQPSGFRVVQVWFGADGRPAGIDDFVTGWLMDVPPQAQPGPKPAADEAAKARRPAQFGRLAGVAVAADGSLLVAEDQNGVIYRVRYGNR